MWVIFVMGSPPAADADRSPQLWFCRCQWWVSFRISSSSWRLWLLCSLSWRHRYTSLHVMAWTWGFQLSGATRMASSDSFSEILPLYVPLKAHNRISLTRLSLTDHDSTLIHQRVVPSCLHPQIYRLPNFRLCCPLYYNRTDGRCKLQYQSIIWFTCDFECLRWKQGVDHNCQHTISSFRHCHPLQPRERQFLLK